MLRTPDRTPDDGTSGFRSIVGRRAERIGVVVEPEPAEAEFAQIREMACHCFLAPLGLPLDPLRLEHYRQGFARTTRYGTTRVVAARSIRSGRICAYAYYQFRGERDVYLRELAAEPRRPDDKARSAGALLLAYSLAHALDAERHGLAMLNVLAAMLRRHTSRHETGRRSDLTRYYERFGFRRHPSPAAGSYSDGRPREPGDVWMVAGVRTAFEAATRIVAEIAQGCRGHVARGTDEIRTSEGS